MLQVLGHGRQLAWRQAQAAGGRAWAGTGAAVAVSANQGGVFIDSPDQTVFHGNGFAGLERHQAFAALDRHLVLDERSAAVDADAVAVNDVFASFMRQTDAYVIA
ncbi:hypothetical protein D3C79_773120 [compost metagenome]